MTTTRTPAEDPRARRTRLLGAFDALHRDIGLALIETVPEEHFFTGTSPQEALAWLRAGVTVVSRLCSRPGYGPEHGHLVHLGADGHVHLLDHPDIDPDVERFMTALGAEALDCMTLAAQATGDPGRAYVDIRNRQTKVRVLYGAVAWAQRQDVDWDTVGPLLRTGLTPAAVEQWHADGWTTAQAAPFWQERVPREQALAWRLAGQPSKRAARLAAKGQTPGDDEPWLAAGFTRAQATPWRVAPVKVPYEPQRAFFLHGLGFSPTSWSETRQHLAASAVGGEAPMSEQILLAWVGAGMPADRVTPQWWEATGGDLDTALAWWRAGVPVHTYRGLLDALEGPVESVPGIDRDVVRAWRAMAARPGGNRVLDPDFVGRWAALTRSLETIMRALVAGVSAADYVAAFPDDDVHALHPSRSAAHIAAVADRTR